MYTALIVGIVVAMVIVMMSAVYKVWPWSPLTAIPVGYYAAAVYLTWRFAHRTLSQSDLISIIIALVSGAVVFPFIVIHRLYWLRRVRIILAAAQGLQESAGPTPSPTVQLDDALYPGSQPASF